MSAAASGSELVDVGEDVEIVVVMVVEANPSWSVAAKCVWGWEDLS